MPSSSHATILLHNSPRIVYHWYPTKIRRISANVCIKICFALIIAPAWCLRIEEVFDFNLLAAFHCQQQSLPSQSTRHASVKCPCAAAALVAISATCSSSQQLQHLFFSPFFSSSCMFTSTERATARATHGEHGKSSAIAIKWNVK